MAFTVVHPKDSQILWAPVLVSDTVYTGAIIGVDAATPLDGVYPMPVASGAGNLTNNDCPMGVCIGNNNVTGNVVYSSTQNAEYITAGNEASAHDITTQFQGAEGPLGNDTFQMVAYHPITAETVLRGPIFNAAVGTAPTVLTVTTGSGSDGLDFVSNANESTTVANYATAYCRSGANAGTYRQIVNASSTSFQNTPAFKEDIAVGDTFVVVNLNRFGHSRCYIDAEGLYLDSNAEVSTNYHYIDVLRLDLSEAGNEYCEFRFNPICFNLIDRIAT
jgi:hypothetical protein